MTAKKHKAKHQSPRPVPQVAPINPQTAEHDTTPKLMSPAKVAAIAKAEATDLVAKQVSGFAGFLREQGVVGLAIGLVLGIQVKAVVDQFMASFVTPLLSLVLPGNQESFARRSFSITVAGNTQTFVWGSFVISLLTLIIVATIIYYAYKLLRLDKLSKK